jgi:hypothetical protein
MQDENLKLIPPKNNDDIDFSPFFDYLKSTNGHEIASRVIGLIEGLKKNTLDIHAEQTRLDLQLTHKFKSRFIFLQGVVFLSTLVVASILVYYDKFNGTVGLLFGTLVGYFFGKKAN